MSDTPQLENGYTKIANEILDALIKYRIPGEQVQVLLYILRKTYGFNKTNDRISNSQFVSATGMKKGNVSRAVKNLVSKNIVIKSDNKYIPTYRFNKNYKTWKVLSILQPVINITTSVIKTDNKLLSKVMDTKESKDNIQKTIKVQAPDWLDLILFNDFLEHRKKLRKPMTERAKEIFVRKVDNLRSKGFDPTELIETAIERGWQTVFEPKDENKSKKITYESVEKVCRRCNSTDWRRLNNKDVCEKCLETERIINDVIK